MFRLVTLIAFIFGYSYCQPAQPQEQTFTITTASDGTPLTPEEYTNVTLIPVANSKDLKVSISAPFYNDPAFPVSDQPTSGLYQREEVEMFFMNDNEQYLHILISPQGNYWISLVNERRNFIKVSGLSLTVVTTIEGGKWTTDGTIIPGNYFPPKVTKFNFVASYGMGDQKKFMSLYPNKGKEPDFHNTPDFGPIDIGEKAKEDITSYSPVWQAALEEEIRMEITETWNGIKVPANETVKISPRVKGNDIRMWVKSPFYNNKPALNEAGKNYKKLENYEDVEFFFLNDNDQYLQVQITPIGDFKVLLFDGQRNLIHRNYTIPVKTYFHNSEWVGYTTIPGSLFPPQATKFSASAIHEVNGKRRYLTLTPSPTPAQEPDFHNIEDFSPLNLTGRATEDINVLSDDWINAMKNEQKLKIDKTFNGDSILVEEQVEVAIKTLQPDSGDLDLWIRSPFYNDSNDNREPGENRMLYVQEAIELYFLNSNDQYFQVQLSPYNQYFGFIYNGERNLVQFGGLPLNVSCRIRGTYWIGEGTIPASYLPPQVTKVGASAMHGQGEKRRFLTANPSTNKVDKPNFHNIQDFQPLNIPSRVEENTTLLSSVWTEALSKEMRFTLNKTWNGTIIPESERVEVSLKITGHPPSLRYWIKSPFYNDTITQEKIGKLWRQEALEMYFANDDGQYLQVLFTPQENYYVKLVNGSRNYLSAGLPLKFNVFITNTDWIVEGSVPTEFLPTQVTKLNAAAQHGEEANRTFLSLVPSPAEATYPDFHNVDEFHPISLTEINQQNVNFSSYWISALRREMNFTIKHTWDGKPLLDNETVSLSLHGSEDSKDITLKIDAPFYNDPAPAGNPGEPFDKLWEYEVVEAFFLNDNDQYLEVEVAPRGQHIVLLLNGERTLIKKLLPLSVTTNIDNSTNRWTGEAIIPGDYLPANVTRFNAYAIHGVEPNRSYSSLYPTDGTTPNPDFHNLKFFQPIYMKSLSPLFKHGSENSSLWKEAIANPEKTAA